MLDTFFDTMGTTHFDNNDYIFDKPMIGKHEGDSSFNWTEDLPPTFHGSTTSLLQPPPLSHALSSVGYGGKSQITHRAQEMQPKITSAEVLAAASTLIRNGQSNQSNRLFRGSLYPAQDPTDGIQEIGNLGCSTGNQTLDTYSNILPALTQQPPSGFTHGRAAADADSGETLFHDMYFGTSSQIRPSADHARKPPDIQWGSDVSFLDHGYVAPPNQETEEEVTKTLMHKMECFEPQGSANTTRPPSPLAMRRGPLEQTTSDDGSRGSGEERMAEDIEEGPGPRKRRKPQHDQRMQRENGERNKLHSNARLKKGKMTSNGKGGRQRRSTTNDSMSKRRKSHSSELKSARENLTEEQKRSNHIMSEQKRRNLIKHGFEDLCKLVPELNGGGFSKSAMLIQAADWLEDVIKGNELLKAQIAGLVRTRKA